ncbi:MAG: ATP-binding cassette domain-containing protein [Thermoanaerobaculia bacterium]|nr:ATP-binding cassette domain-containing protein [Thermoanaerobaculia bacterium]
MSNSSSAGPLIVIEDVHHRFGDREVLCGVSFEVKAGETLCILGGSGDGKTTLLKIMIGALKPTSGRVLVDGEDVCAMRGSRLQDFRRKIGVTFQSGALLSSLTVAENLALPLEYHTRLDVETIETIIKIKLQQVDLRQAADLRPSELSGGMRKRAAIARALALDPKILFYDEPSAGLDPIATARIDRLINDLKENMSITSVVVTHVMESVRRIADHVILQYRGKVLLDGTVNDLQVSADPRVRQFVNGDLEPLQKDATSLESYHLDLLM